VDAAGPVPYLDVLATVTADGKNLYVIAINRHFDRSVRTRVNLRNFNPLGTASVKTLAGTGLDANTGTSLPDIAGWAQQVSVAPYLRFPYGSPTEVDITTSTLSGIGSGFEYVFPPASVTMLVLPAR
jgi:hypothetical protein